MAGYRVEYQPDPALQWQRLQGSRQTDTTYTLSGINCGASWATTAWWRCARARTAELFGCGACAGGAGDAEEIPEEVGYLVAKRDGS